MLLMPLHRPLRGWFLLFLTLNMVDIVSTFLILHAGMVVGNPVATFLLHHVGIVAVMLGKVAFMVGVTLGVDQFAKRSPRSLDTACNVLIGLSGVVLLLFTVNMPQCALVYFS